ncbi:MAG: Flp pilus assembly protein CpaB [Cyanobacteria bacterium SZAS LIN-2]|nr:Flp pilus assembly protein CpaB [Cyanobacteria bacterium SZAS LIN-2]MBS2007289.1 Flp pilus assembly protein CpaB [Cyanobacteria bacterium SZAS TMP-1]
MKSMGAPTLSPSVDWDKQARNLKPNKKATNPLFLVLAVVLLVLLGSAVYRATNSAPAEVMIPVVTSVRDVPPGAKLGLMNLKLLKVPKRLVTPDMVTSLSYAAGSTARSYIAPGEPIDQRQLFAHDTSLASTLETHERAITLQMPEDSLIDHCINPDDRVDVICISNNKDGKKFTRTIAVDARVLMCVQKEQLLARRVGNSNSNMITLAVTPDLAEAISEAAEVGKIRLVLRNRLTRIEPRLKGVGPDDLLPASAFAVEKSVQAAAPSAELPAIPAPPLVINPIDAASSAADAVRAMPAPTPGPVEWVVEMFSGSHKESYAVSGK